MNLVEELQSLDANDVGRWPLAVPRCGHTLLFSCLSRVLESTFSSSRTRRRSLSASAQTEVDLRLTFENKQDKAANYQAYEDQLEEIKESFGTMLRQLPGETEIPSLIVDISQTGLAAGLQEKLFVPQPEIPRDFYAEKPINIRLTGSYHEIGNFVSGIAALPRIVTLHDINITPEDRRVSTI